MRVILAAAVLLTAQPAFGQVRLVSEPSRAHSGPLTYAEAVRQSLATGRPMLTWVGGNFCPRCVNDTAGEFVHYFTPTWPDAPVPSIVVAVPENGRLMRIGTVTQWVEGSTTHGHIPSSRKVIAAYRGAAGGAITAPAFLTPFAAPPPPLFQPVSFRPAPRMMSRGRACAT